MSNVAFLKTDLSLLRLVGPDADATWRPQPVPEDDPNPARLLRQRADDAATWIATQPHVRRRVASAVLDVDDALCAWVKAPSVARPVLTAALRSLMQEWGDEHTADPVEALVDPSAHTHSTDRSPLLRRLRRLRKREETGAEEAHEHEEESLLGRGVACPVVSVPDALPRLWLDALDRRSVRVSRVMSLWHALGVAWNDTPEETLAGVLLIDEERLVWSWSEGERLVAGGVVGLDRPRAPQGEDAAEPESIDQRPAACKRLSLDWLTWSSQLSKTPERVVIVGPECRRWADTLAGQWAPVDVECIEQPAPIASTLAALARAPGIDAPPRSSRRCLQGLTHRPTRALRARYRLAGAAMIFLVLAVGSVAFRLRQKANEWRDEALAVSDESVQIVREAFPALSNARIQNPDQAARNQVQQLITQEPFDPPPPPRPILEEIERIASILSAPDMEAEIRVLELQLDQDRGCELAYTVPDRQVAAEILSRLRSGDERHVDWEYRARTSDPLRPRLNGDWILKPAE